MTDNKNRTAGDMRHYFDKFGGNLGANGCVSWMFDKKGVIIIENTAKVNEDQLMMDALEAGAEDINTETEYFEILTSPNDFSTVREALEAKGYEFVSAEVTMIPQNTVTLDEEAAAKMRKLIDHLEDNDDVQNVYHNWDMPEDDDE